MDGDGSQTTLTFMSNQVPFAPKVMPKRLSPLQLFSLGREIKGQNPPWCSGEVRNAVVTAGQWHPTTGSIADSQVGTCFVELQVY